MTSVLAEHAQLLTQALAGRERRRENTVGFARMLAAMPAPPGAWAEHAECAKPEHAGVTWFPSRGESAEPAKAVCTRCPVADACLDYALDQPGTLEGIWAATSQGDRRRRRRVTVGTSSRSPRT